MTGSSGPSGAPGLRRRRRARAAPLSTISRGDSLPTFDTLPLNEARANSATSQRAALLQEYMGYIQRVAPGQAGRLEAEPGETAQAIRRRLAAAAEALRKELQVRRVALTQPRTCSLNRM